MTEDSRSKGHLEDIPTRVACGHRSRMGGKESAPLSPYVYKYKVRILVAGNTNCGVIEPEQLINKFVYNDYQPVRNIAVPLDIITISIDNIRVNIDIKDISTMMNAVDAYDHLLQVELAQYPHVGVMLIYNPTMRYSFEGVKEIVDIHLPRLLQESWATAKSVPVTIVGDECLLRGE